MELKTLIAECTAYDFKVMLEEKKPKSWLKSVSAFANGLGGSLLLGIDNDGIVKGLDDICYMKKAIDYLRTILGSSSNLLSRNSRASSLLSPTLRMSETCRKPKSLIVSRKIIISSRSLRQYQTVRCRMYEYK